MDRVTNAGAATVSSDFARALLDTAGELGLSRRRIARTAELPEALLARRGVRFPVERLRNVWLAAERDDGPMFGLRAAEVIRPGALGIVDYMMSASATCGAALARLVHYAPLLGNAARLSLSRDGALIRCRYDCPDGLEPTVEFALAVIALRIRELARSSVHGARDAAPLERVAFRHARRGELQHYLRIFGAPVGFRQRHDELVFERGLFELPVGTIDLGLLDILGDHADALLARIERPAPPSSGGSPELSEIRACVRSALSHGNPSIRSTARLLGMSPRTVQRRLQQHSTSYRDIVQQVRAAVMAELLSAEQPTRSRLAQALAYSSERSVDRAYRRLEGMARPPTELSPGDDHDGTTEYTDC
jgi:AraC-like DNA-binding protein